MSAPQPAAAALEVAREAALAGAAVLRGAFGREARDVRTKSTPTDLVSEVDVAAERAVRDVLARRAPGDPVLGEEGGGQEAAATGDGRRWIVDPLDGTVNFLFGIPHWAVSIACEDAAGVLAGVVLDPHGSEEFTAVRGGEAALRAGDAPPEPLRGSERDGVTLDTALISTGFNYDAAVRAEQARIVARLLPVARDVRRFGAAALDLAWTAAGRYDAYYERGVNHWDVAAGALLCERAGLELRPLAATGRMPDGLLVAPPALVEPLLAVGV